MKRIWMVTALVVAVFGGACGGSNETHEASTANAPARDGKDDKTVAFTAVDLDQFERGGSGGTRQPRARSLAPSQGRLP